MKILFFIGDLNTGGAERQLTQLAKGLSDRGHNATVVTIFSGGQFSDSIQRIPEIKLFSLWPKRSNFFLVRVYQILYSPVKLIRYIKECDLCYSMLAISNFIAWVSTRFLRNTKLVWGIRASTRGTSWKMVVFNKLSGLVSSSVRLIIFNSHKGLDNHIKYGYRAQKILVISNGIDVDQYKFDRFARNKLRRKHFISSTNKIIGIVSRIDPMKDHTTFFKAAALIAEKIDRVVFIVVGDGAADYIEELHNLVEKLGLSDQVIWFGNRSDLVTIYSTLDVLVSSSSYGEGFSNVIGEAMSCGIPCVVTDVGDSAMIVGDPTRVVIPGDPEMMASAILKVLQINKEEGALDSLRNRITDNFSISKLVDQTEKALEDVIQCQ